MSVSVKVGPAPFVPAEELAAFEQARGGETGACVSFSGYVRAERGGVERLVLQHYPGYTEQEIERIAGDAARRFSTDAIRIRHRVGAMTPGEVIVFVAVAAAHRRAAFEACDMLMDYLKSAAPFWKKEEGPGGARWIEPTDEDHADRRRWEKDNARD